MSSVFGRSSIYNRNKKRLEKIRASKKHHDRRAAPVRVLAQMPWPVGHVFALPDESEFCEDEQFNDNGITTVEFSSKLNENSKLSSDVTVVRAFVGGAFGGILEAILGRTQNDVLNRLYMQAANSISLQQNHTSTLQSHFFPAMNIVDEAGTLKSYYLSSAGSTNETPKAKAFSSVSRVSCATEGIWTSAISAGILFGSNNYICSQLNVDRATASAFDSNFMLSSILTGVVTATFFTPFELVRSKILLSCNPACMQSMNRNYYRNSQNILKTYVRELLSLTANFGISSLYLGGRQIFVREMFGNLAYFSTYQMAKMNMKGRNDEQGRKTFNPVNVCIAGGTAGIAYWSLVYPLDMHRAIVQSRPIKGTRLLLTNPSNGMIPITSLYRGYLPCLLRAIPANALLFLGYEWCMNSLENP